MIHLSQHTYIDLILCCYNFDNLKPLSIPMDPSIQLSSNQSPATTAKHAIIHNKLYCKVVSTLNWAALTTHPDITFAVATIIHFAAKPGIVYQKAVKWIYCYLAGMHDLQITYGETRQVLEGYINMDSSMNENQYAILGYVFLINGGTVSWSSKQQESVSLSTTKGKYVATTHSIKEALWL